MVDSHGLDRNPGHILETVTVVPQQRRRHSTPHPRSPTGWYVGSDDASIHALLASNGDLLWNPYSRRSRPISPSVANGVVYVGSDSNNVYALNASPSYGTQLWSFTTGGLVGSSPAVANGVVYVGSDDGNLYAFDLAGGLIKTTRPTAKDLRP